MTLLFDFDSSDRVGGTTFVNYYASISANTSSAKVASACRQATQLYLLPKVGVTFYEHLASKNNPNENEAVVLESWRDAVAHYTIYQMASTGLASMGELGLRQMTDSENAAQSISSWQYFAMQYNLVRNADAFVEISLQYIEDHKATFHAHYEATHGVLIVPEPADFAEILGIERNITLYRACANAIKTAGVRLIQPILRETNYTALLDAIEAGNTNSLDAELQEAWRLARDVVAPAALLAAMPRLNLDLSNGKLEAISIQDGLDRRRTATEESIAGLKAQLEREMEQARDLLIAYVAENANALGIEQSATNASRVIDTGKTVFIRRK